MTAVSQVQKQVIQPAEVARITASWPDLLKRPIQDNNEFDLIQTGIQQLSEPPRRDWILVRVAALLTQYYVVDVPQSLVRVMADDWAAELDQWPEWTIEKAIRWWKSADNPDRKRRPLEGDISARARIEFGIVIVANLAVKRFKEGREPYQPSSVGQAKRVDRLRAEQIMEEAGFKPKRFGGARSTCEIESTPVE